MTDRTRGVAAATPVAPQADRDADAPRAARAGTAESGGRRRTLWLVHAALLLGAVVMVGPFLWEVLTSLKTLSEATRVPPTILPNSWRWENFSEVFDRLPFSSMFANTVLMTIGRTLGQLVFCSLAAYAFARLEFP